MATLVKKGVEDAGRDARQHHRQTDDQHRMRHRAVSGQRHHYGVDGDRGQHAFLLAEAVGEPGGKEDAAPQRPAGPTEEDHSGADRADRTMAVGAVGGRETSGARR